MNIQKVLTLLNQRMTDADIGKEIGLSQASVNRLRNGVNKRTFNADAIKELARREGVLESEDNAA